MCPTITLPADGGTLNFAWDADLGPVTMTAHVDAPVNLTLPSLAGDALVGSILTVTPGTWTGNPLLTYRWTADGVETAAAGLTYAIAAGDAGRLIGVVEVATNGGGTVEAIASTVIGPIAVPAPPHPPGMFIRPTAVGKADGSNWDNAGALASLTAFMAAIPDGQTIFIRADEGPYTGFAGAAVARANISVQGINADYSPAVARIEGSRTAWTLPADPEAVTWVGSWATGGHFVQFNDGAANIKFSGLDLHRFGDAFYSACTTTYLDGIVIDGCTGYNVRRFFEQATTVKGATNCHIKNGSVTGFSKTCIRWQNDSHDCTVEDMVLNSGRQDGDNFAMGVQCESAVVPSHHITCIRVTCENMHSTSAGTGYAQGDGFVAEYGCHDITWIDSLSRGNTDGGWDIKGHGHRLIRCTGEDNKRNLRNWGTDTVALGCSFRKAHKRVGGGSHVVLWCGSTSGMVTAQTYAHLTLDKDLETGKLCELIASPETAVCEKDKGGFQLNNTDITKPAATVLCFSASSGGGSFSMDAYTTAHVINI